MRVLGAKRSERRVAMAVARPAGPSLLRLQRHALFGKRLDAAPAGPRLSPEIAFLAHHRVSPATLAAAAEQAERHAASHREELFAVGFERETYWSLLAHDLGLAYADDLANARLCNPLGMLTTDAVRKIGTVMVEIGGRRILVTAPGAEEIALLKRTLRATPALAARICIASPETIRAFIVGRKHKALTHYALNRLSRVLPLLSTEGHWRRRNGASGHTLLVAALLGAALIAPFATFKALSLVATLFFLNCSFWKLAAAFNRHRPLRLEPVPDRNLPTYTVLVPLYREAAVVPDLVRHLKRLDYPASKLQILLILETDDLESRAAAARHADAPHFEILMTPPSHPRTKPKALTYALNFARGDYVVVFDAEDRPEPDQLRKAAAAFREQPLLGCVQARLTPDNRDSWFARMFALEYAANFDVLLPALASWRVPLPLGGTSNHFPREVLEAVGAWDPYNVTEDADLGVRLARFGYQSATLHARTFEEAPVTFRQWLPQRRRWVKGWMQTVAICAQRGKPSGLRLSLREQLAVHGILTAGVLGLLLYPVSLIFIA